MSRSLGVLTLDLIAKTGGFESGMDKAARVADKKTREIERQARERAKAIEDAFTTIGGGIAAAFAGIQISDTVRQFFELGKQIERSAAVANVGANTIQVWTAATKSLGIEQEKLADIFKDVDDKVGDFTANGAGPMKDFMEQWGRAAGITADQLKRLAGPDVLQLVAKTMQDAGASTSEITFMLEALASDASHLTPILADNAKGLKEAADRAQELGLILSDETLGGIKEVREGFTELQDGAAGWGRQLGGDLIPVLVELKRNLDAVWTTLDSMGVVIDSVITVAFKSLASVAITVSKAFEYAGSAIGGTLAALSFAATGEFSAALDVLRQMDKELARIDSSVSAAVGRVWSGTTKIEPLPQAERTGRTAKPSVSSGKGGSSKSKGASYTDPLAESAKAYARALESLNQIQEAAETSGLNLSRAQSELLAVMTAPEWLAMPEQWKLAVVAQAEFAHAAEMAAAEQARLNELLAATPTAQLEAQRNTMLFLAQAFEQGRISAEQFSQAAQTALGNLPSAAEPVKDSFLDLTTVANDAARTMASGFTDYLFDPMNKSIKDMLANFLKAVAQMMVQSLMLQAVKAGMGALGIPFAKGGVFDGGGLQAFAKGGVVNTPTYFKFADGGSFKNGLMGEAGPEAIMPLQRGPGGKLGVSMFSGGGGEAGDTIIHITINEGERQESSNGRGDEGRQLARMIEGAVLKTLADQKRPGGMLYQ